MIHYPKLGSVEIQKLKICHVRLQGRYSLLIIIFGDVIIVLAEKSIATCSFTLLSISVMI